MNTRTVSNRRGGGFTLIELLVAITVILILVGALLPALSHARYSARNIICKNNLRQIANGLNLYATTHGVFPPGNSSSGNWFANLDLPVKYESWKVSSPLGVSTYRIAGGPFRCPLNKGMVRQSSYIEPATGREIALPETLFASQTAYGYNVSGIGSGNFSGLGLGGFPLPVSVTGQRGSFVVLPFSEGIRATLESEVQAPSDMIAFGDEFLRSRNPALDAAISRDGTIAPATFYGGPGAYNSTITPKKQPGFLAHRGRCNRAFVDGHVEAEDLRSSFAASDTELERWNLDNEPHRERLSD